EFQPEVPALPRLLDDLEALHRPLGGLRFGRQALGRFDGAAPDELVGVGRATHGLAATALRPAPLLSRPLEEPRSLGAVALVALVTVQALPRPFFEVCGPPTGVLAGGVVVAVELDDALHDPIE